MRHKVEVWDVVKTVDEFGIPQETKKLLFKLPAAVKEVSNEIKGDTTKSILAMVQVTVRFNRSLQHITSSMYIVMDGIEFDIVSAPNNYWKLNKYVSFNAVARNK